MSQLEVVIPNLTLELFIFIFAFIALGSCLYLITQFGQGALIIPFTHFGSGIIFLALSRAFFFLTTMEVYHLQKVTLDLWVHIIFYLSVISFIWGGMRLRQVAIMPQTAGYATHDFFLIVALFLVEFLVFGLAQPLEGQLAPLLNGSLIDSLGLPHFISFALAIVAGAYIYKIKSDWVKLLPVGVYPMLTFLALLAAKHLLELLTHNLGILHLPMETTSFLDQLILILGILSLIFGFIRISGNIEQARTTVTPGKS